MTPAHLLADLAAAFLAAGAVPGPHVSHQDVFAFQDPAIDESSALLVHGQDVLTINDSGDGPVVYVVDRQTGATVGHTTYSRGDVVDVEALADGPRGSVWVGDIGDNGATRPSVAVYRLPPITRGDHQVTGRRYDLYYRGGPRDAETLLADPRSGRLYVVSKGLFGGQVFAAPRHLRAGRPNILRPVADVDLGLATDGFFFPDGRHVLVRNYSVAEVLDTRSWRVVARMPLPHEHQGEGIGLVDGGRDVMVSSEGTHSEVLSVPLPKRVLRAVSPAAHRSPNPRGRPSAGSVTSSASTSSGTDVTVLLVGAAAAVALGAFGVLVVVRRR